MKTTDWPTPDPTLPHPPPATKMKTKRLTGEYILDRHGLWPKYSFCYAGLSTYPKDDSLLKNWWSL